ncbi:MAG: hypothetical protein WD055_05960 [Candidatus Dependentiae bacterium]
MKTNVCIVMLAALFTFGNMFSMDPEKVADPVVERYKRNVDNAFDTATNANEMVETIGNLSRSMEKAGLKMYFYQAGPETPEKTKKLNQFFEMKRYLESKIAQERERYNTSTAKAAKK